MTREEAYKLAMQACKETWNDKTCKQIKDVLQQQPCDDCISRQSIKRKLQENHDFFIHAYGEFSNLSQNDKSRVDEIINCIAMVVNEPSVTPKEKTGKWLHREDMDYLDKNEVMHNHFMCKDCGFIHDFIDGHTVQYRYCPSCGAKMVEPQESEE